MKTRVSGKYRSWGSEAKFALLDLPAARRTLTFQHSSGLYGLPRTFMLLQAILNGRSWNAVHFAYCGIVNEDFEIARYSRDGFLREAIFRTPNYPRGPFFCMEENYGALSAPTFESLCERAVASIGSTYYNTSRPAPGWAAATKRPDWKRACFDVLAGQAVSFQTLAMSGDFSPIIENVDLT